MKVFGGKDYSLVTVRESLGTLFEGTIDAGDTKDIVIEVPNGYSAVLVTVKATYNASATSGVRVRWLFSQDGTDYDSPEDAEEQGNYEDLTFSAGKTRQRSVLVPALTPYIKVQVVNLDTSYPVAVKVTVQRMR